VNLKTIRDVTTADLPLLRRPPVSPFRRAQTNEVDAGLTFGVRGFAGH